MDGLDADQCYRALRSRDARFDGRFYTGVTSTRIYCRPVCTVRAPLPRNCRYFPSAAAAELAGFRPCLRCRPELAPGVASVDAPRRLALAAAHLINEGSLADCRLDALARRLAVSDRHLRRVFHGQLGCSPVFYAQTQRLLLAKGLLTDTAMPIVEVALASGFGSLRRFNDLFAKRYRMTPTMLRARQKRAADAPLGIELGYRPPYEWHAILGFLRRRAITGVELVDDDVYRRTMQVGGRGGWVEVRHAPTRSALRVNVSESLAPVLPTVLSRIRALFDLACQPTEIAAALGPLAAPAPGLRVPGAVDGFEVAVRGILGQQITVKAATTVAGRFAAAFGERYPTPWPGLDRLFPKVRTIAGLAAGAIAKLGIVGTRANAIVLLARALKARRLALDPIAEVDTTVAALEALPGVGPWTAQYIAMRALAWPDAFPHPDVGVLRGMGADSPRAARETAERWRPFRSYAVLHLWHSLEESA